MGLPECLRSRELGRLTRWMVLYHEVVKYLEGWPSGSCVPVAHVKDGSKSLATTSWTSLNRNVHLQFRRDGRVVEGAGLENRCALKGAGF